MGSDVMVLQKSGIGYQCPFVMCFGTSLDMRVVPKRQYLQFWMGDIIIIIIIIIINIIVIMIHR